MANKINGSGSVKVTALAPAPGNIIRLLQLLLMFSNFVMSCANYKYKKATFKLSTI